ALDRLDVQSLAVRDEAVLGELPGRVVQDGDARSGGGEDGGLLATPRGQAEDVQTRQRGKPGARHGPGRGEDDLPVAPAGCGRPFRISTGPSSSTPVTRRPAPGGRGATSCWGTRSRGQRLRGGPPPRPATSRGLCLPRRDPARQGRERGCDPGPHPGKPA